MKTVSREEYYGFVGEYRKGKVSLKLLRNVTMWKGEELITEELIVKGYVRAKAVEHGDNREYRIEA